MTENEQRLQRLLSGISPLYEAPMREAKARQDALAKPPGSLGLLEEISIRLAGITGTVKNEASPTRIYVLPPTTAWSARASRPRRNRSRARRPSA